ncbi:MAG: DUF3393 domain-containing protein [Magnetococcales bacterium]|nr:DUF3393 domain-containing protein [Magnetococcales bacterium]
MKHPPVWIVAPLLLGIGACSVSQAVDIARGAASGDIGGTARRMAQNAAIGYASHPEKLFKDLERFKTQLARFLRQVESIWGDKEQEQPRPKKYVKYSEGYRVRVLVDFEQGWLRVETVGEAAGLRSGIVAALLSPGDPRTVELYSDETESFQGEPYLYRQVVDHEGRAIRDRGAAERFADHLLAHAVEQRRAGGAGEGGEARMIRWVQIPLVKDHLMLRARAVRELVERHAAHYRLSRSLVYAIIKTESDFNRLAVSSAPAFGLMQIVPSTAGRDAWKRLHGEDGLPTPDYLFDPENNIRMGTLYLSMLFDEMLVGVEEETAREYCVIAAYNGGVGRVLRSFHANREKALAAINALSPGEVRTRLMEKMPEETRHYLKHVLEAKRLFVSV